MVSRIYSWYFLDIELNNDIIEIWIFLNNAYIRLYKAKISDAK